MDIQLPGLDGYEATRRIKADVALRAIPVIAVTCYGLTGDAEKARAAGCDAYISKPYSPRQLLAKVREYLSSPVIEHWMRVLRRRSQRSRRSLSWSRMKRIAEHYLPHPRILHPWPEQRFLVTIRGKSPVR
jgi:DNA-binding response OmpR family regulator